MRRFFCENCGKEVSERDEICPHCGAVFSAIKCPRCGYRGKLHEFRHGCPVCGFLGEDRVRETYKENGETDHQSSMSPAISPGKGDQRPRRTSWLFRRTVDRAGNAPSWLFWLILFTMLLSFAVLSIIYTGL